MVLLDFVLGTAVLALPPQQQIPLAIGAALVKGIQGLRRRGAAAHRDTSSASTSDAGKEEVTLEWSHVTCTLSSSKDRTSSSRALLDDQCGIAKPGRLLAVCGPSGSGKTTLLNVLAGQLPYSKQIRLEGRVRANGAAVPAQGVRSGFVAQEDLFFSQLTVRETLEMAAELRATSSTTPEERAAAVDAVIRRLGLAKCADTPVGDAKTRGLSGGEKKRLSIACELIARPQLIFADEPTSGLDAFAAQQAMQALKDLTTDGHTVIATIHQPRSSIFAMFDDLCLLSEGRLLYFGPAAEALEYFKGLGHECPEHYNPAEFLADLVAIDHSSPESEEKTRAKVDALAAAWAAKSSPSVSSSDDVVGSVDKPGTSVSGALTATSTTSTTTATMHRPGCGLRRQVALLLRRSWRQVTRDRATAASRASSQLSSALVFSSIYWRLGMGQAAIQSRMGLLQVI
jgi:ABC-type multidrug transport system ATPase subunit